MKIRPLSLIALCIVASATGIYGQVGNSPTPFYGYYYDYKLANPAFTGSQRKHVVTTVYSGYPSGNTAAMFYGSYEMNIAPIKSGIGMIFIYDHIGPYTGVFASALYSKQISFNETSGLRLGTQVLYQSQITDYSFSDPLDPGDPLIGDTGKEIKRNINFDLGLAYYSPYITAGASVKNLLDAASDITTLNVVVTREFKVVENLKVTPSIFFTSDFVDKELHLNSALEIAQWILLGSGYRFADRGRGNFTVNAGLNIKDWVQIIAHLYSSANYNYVNPFDNGRFIEMMIRVKIPGTTSGNDSRK